MVTSSKNTRNAIERCERKDASPCLLFDIETYKAVSLKNHDDKQCFIFPSKRSLGEAICRSYGHNMHSNPSTIIYSAYTKAVKKYKLLGNAFPNVINVKEWNTPNLVKFTTNKIIVITPYMLWDVIKDNVKLQQLYNLNDKPSTDTSPKKKFGKIHHISNVKHLLICHPTDDSIAFMLETPTDTINAKTKLITVSTKGEKVQELTHHVDKNGYPYVQQRSKNVHTKKYVHKLVAETFLKPSYKTDVINHIDGDTLNWHPSNLEWVSRSANSKHTHVQRDEKFLDNNAIRLESWKWCLTI